MKAVAIVPKEKTVKVIDHPEPALASPTQVKIKIIRVGVCGTDREIWNLEYGTPPAGSDYLVTGHESFGRVVEIGAQVKSLHPGDYVVATVRRGCPERCAACASGRPDFCFTGNFKERGIKELHGYMTETIVEEEANLAAVPAELKDIAVLLEPLTIAEKALLELNVIQSRLPWECRLQGGIKDRSCRNAVILGAGPVGLLGAMAFRARDMRTVVVSRERKPSPRVALIESLGIEYLSTGEFSARDIAKRVGNIDLLFEATGVAQVSFDYLQELGTNGIFIFTGVPGLHRQITLDGGTLMRDMVLRNQVVLGTVNAPMEAFHNGLDDLHIFNERWPNQIRSIISKRVPLEHFEDAWKKRGADEIKTVLEISKEA